MEPIILDTDLGTDIDDCWALGFLLSSPHLQSRLILTASGDTLYRGLVAARFLHQVHSSNLAIGIGMPTTSPGKPYRETLHRYIGEYKPGDYPGPWYDDGISRAIELMEQLSLVTIIAIGPFTNLAEICRRRPDLVSRCRLVAMGGALRCPIEKGPEYNIACDVPAARTVFSADWREFLLMPLDHCDRLVLSGDVYAQVASSPCPIAREVIKSYHAWLADVQGRAPGRVTESSVLFDTAAVHLAETESLCIIEPHRLLVDGQGTLRESSAGREIRVAVGWRDQAAFLTHLAASLCRPAPATSLPPLEEAGA